MNYEREEIKLKHAVDQHFNTSSGAQWVGFGPEGQPVGPATMVVDSENLFSALARLKVILCGGTISSIFSASTINDLDFYCKERNTKEVIELFTKYFGPPVFTSTNAVSFARRSTRSRKIWRVQLITRFVGEPEEIFEWFDFTVTHGAYDFERKMFVFGDRFFADLSQRRLVYSGASLYPICAMYRTKKYQERGFKLSGATIMHIALSIIQLDIKTYGQLKEQLMGIDTMYLQDLLGKKPQDAPVDYGEFIAEAFKAIDGIIGDTEGEKADDDLL
jgi:hypothetical protein